MYGNYFSSVGLDAVLTSEVMALPWLRALQGLVGGVTFGLGCGGDRPRSSARAAMPVGHGLGGVLPQRTRMGKFQTTGAENTREGAHVPPS